MLRSPLLPLSDLTSILSTVDGAEDVDRQILERSMSGSYSAALRVSSPSLHSSLKSPPRSEKSAARRSSALYRFFARASARSTPYGAFAAVGLGRVGDETSLSRAEDIKLSSRPDAAWLIAAGEAITTSTSLQMRPLILNPQLIVAGGRVVLPYADTTGAVDNRRVDIRYTEAVGAAMQVCDGTLGLMQAVDRILERQPHYPRSSVEQLMKTLLDLHIVAPMNLVQTGSRDQSGLLRGFSSHTDQSSSISEILDSIRSVVQLSNETIGDLGAIEALQSTLCSGKPGETVQIDGVLKLNHAEVSRSMISRIEDAVDAIAALTPVQRPPQLEEFHSRCVERYGIYAEVPLKELLSEESGVGPPNDYIMPRAKAQHAVSPPSNGSAWQQISSRLVAEALMSGATKVDLEDALRLIPDRKEEAQFVPSLDVFASFAAPGQDSDSPLVVLSTDGITEGGRTFGRFLNVLDDSVADSLRDLYKSTYPPSEFLVAEVRYLPTSGRAANVTTVPPLTEAEIVVNVAPTGEGVSKLELDDVMVGLADDRFAFRMKGDHREVKAVQSHMLNTLMAPNPLRFLIEATQESSGLVPYLDVSHLSSLSYVPRFALGDVVVRVARWTIHDIGQVETEESFNNWRQKFTVPKYVYLTEADNRLMLDLDSVVGHRELVRALQQRSDPRAILILEECLPLPHQAPLLDESRNEYALELVVPIVNRGYRAERALQDGHARSKLEAVDGLNEIHRVQGIGDTWTSFKLYAPFARHDEVLQSVVRPLMEAHGIEWFYVEYADPYSHLRVRARTTGSLEMTSSLLDAFATAKHEDAISRFEVGTYDREMERYGGPGLIAAAEALFHASSVFSVKAMEVSRSHDIEREWLTMLSLEVTTGPWRPLLPQNTSDGPKIDDSTRRRFYKSGKDLTELLAPWRGGPMDDVRSVLSAELDLIRLTSESLASLIEIHQDDGTLISTPDGILGSILHMQCNRLLTGDRATEDQVMHLWFLSRDAIRRRPVALEVS